MRLAQRRMGIGKSEGENKEIQEEAEMREGMDMKFSLPFLTFLCHLKY